MTGATEMLTVSELNRVVRELLEGAMMPFWLTGQIGDLTIHRSGHVYLSLKDDRATIRGVYFNGAGAARALNLREGDEVEVFGSVTLYEARGTYQISIRELRPKGVGTLQQQFEKLKAQLQAEGLFETDRKRPIPRLPKCVGVVTSPDGAAVRDFLNVLGRRFAGMHVRIVPAAVQGENAAPQVVAGIQHLNRTRACDVIVVTRGGGSLEDLWAFNEETVARAIAASEIPVISAIGHEVDFTIADFVADLRAPTPSAAAEIVVAQHGDLIDRVAHLRHRLGAVMRLGISELRTRVNRAARHYVFREPLHLVRRHQQRVDDLQLRLERGLTFRLTRERDRLLRLESKLPLLDPRRVLHRGYAILLDRKDGRAILSPNQVATGDAVHAIVAEGTLDLTVSPPQEDTHE